MRPKTSAGDSSGPRELALALAPSCRLLRDAVARALATGGPGSAALTSAWRRLLGDDADDARIADACAQTATFTRLLAHPSSDADPRAPAALARALATLTELGDELAEPLARLDRTIAAFAAFAADLRVEWYEEFLAAYDPHQRREAGVYYTPAEVVDAQLALTRELLARELEQPLGFAGPGVLTIDPACGTGTYLARLIADALDPARVDPAELAGRATRLAGNLAAFELLPGPWAVAHARLGEALRSAGARLPPGGARVLLRDTLAAPDEYEHPEADARVLVCIGNPPYDRQELAPDAHDHARRGGWVRHGDPAGSPPILADFLPPPASGAGRHVKNVYNDYVYFWRWALWRVFERREGPGVVCFVTAASFLRGPGFSAMRRHMRATLDELWIVDLGGDARGPRRSANVFAVATPVCITVALRRGRPHPGQPARVWYSRLPDDLDRAHKLARLRRLRSRADLEWQRAPDGWEDPFVPALAGDVARWPGLDALFPWHHSGAQWKRTWPIGPTRELLERRWRTLLAADDRRALFHESETWTVARASTGLLDPRQALPPLASLATDAPAPPIVRYAWRAFDRQWCLADARLGDRLRPALWQIHGQRQIYLTTLMSTGLSHGPALVACADVPDLHHFRGSFGDRGVIPLWRDADATEPNITTGLLAALAARLGRPVAPETLCAYVYACLACPAYGELLAEALAEPGPRVPITADRALFSAMVELGRQLLRIHTYGERLRQPASPPRTGAARCVAPVPADDYPETFAHDGEALRVGRGLFAPVSRAVWQYAVSGFGVLRGWLGARVGPSRARRSSPLDALRPTRWTASMSAELLELVWLLEGSLEIHRKQDVLLRQIVAGPLIPADALPRPAPGQERAPAPRVRSRPASNG